MTRTAGKAQPVERLGPDGDGLVWLRLVGEGEEALIQLTDEQAAPLLKWRDGGHDLPAGPPTDTTDAGHAAGPGSKPAGRT